MDIDPVGWIMTWMSQYGLAGLFLVAIAERFVPVMPSYGMLLAIGLGAADGAWPLTGALMATVGGGVIGSAGGFFAVRRLGEARSTRLLLGTGRVFGLPAHRIEHWVFAYRRHQIPLAFGLLLVPTVRLLVPIFAALMGSRPRAFLVATTTGITVWNGLFIGIGYFASHSLAAGNMTLIALATLGALLLAEGVLIWVVRRFRERCYAGALP